MKSPVSILHADSNAFDRDLLRDTLQERVRPFRVTGASSRREVEAHLAELDFDVVISDHSLCDLPSLEVLDLVRTWKPTLPVVIMTGAGSEELAAESIKRGAADYISKRSIQQLPAVLGRAITGSQCRPPLPKQDSALRNLVDGLDVVMFSVDRLYTYTSFNRAHASAMQTFYGANINLGDNFLDHISIASDRNVIRHHLDRALAGEHVEHEAGSAHVLFAERTFLASYAPMKDAAGRVLGVAVLARDMTMRLTAEQALRDSERRLTEAQRIAHIGYWERDVRAGHITLSDEACRIFGISPEAVPLGLERWHRRWLELIHTEDQPRAAKAAADALAGGPPYNLEYRVVRPGGEVRFIHSEADVRWDAEGRPLSMLGMMQDVTEYQQVVDALREAERQTRLREEYFRQLIENASDLIIVIDYGGIITFASPSSESVLGYAPEELVGTSVMGMIHPEDVQRARAALAQALECPGVPVTFEHRARHRDGHWAVMHTAERSVPGQSTSGFVVLNSRDHSEHRRLEEQLHHSQKLDAIGQLAGGIAHDFNNLLAAIMMEISLLGLSTLSDDVRDGLDQINDAAERAASLTRQLLMFSRRQVMQRRTLDFNDVVMDLMKILTRIIGENIHLETALHPTALRTNADPGMLDQLLLNLVINARDAMPEGGRLFIGTEPVVIDRETADGHPDAQPGQYARLTLIDTGAGIAAELRDRIFEPFFSTKPEGTGLGLATVFGIVKQHAGWIQVDSEVGKGTKFDVFLPLTESAPTATSRAPANQELTGTETILLVEDETRVRKLASTVLERAGYVVFQVADGETALSMWPELNTAVGLLISDLVLPGGVSGPDLARRLTTSVPSLKVLFMSGYSADLAGKQLELGIGEGFLPKPFTPDQLLEAVRRCLDG